LEGENEPCPICSSPFVEGCTIGWEMLARTLDLGLSGYLSLDSLSSLHEGLAAGASFAVEGMWTASRESHPTHTAFLADEDPSVGAFDKRLGPRCATPTYTWPPQGGSSDLPHLPSLADCRRAWRATGARWRLLAVRALLLPKSTTAVTPISVQGDEHVIRGSADEL